MKVRELMNRNLVTIAESCSCFDAITRMQRTRVRHLPVIEEGKLVGIISIGDLVKSIIADQKFIIEQLERYITS